MDNRPSSLREIVKLNPLQTTLSSIGLHDGNLLRHSENFADPVWNSFTFTPPGGTLFRVPNTTIVNPIGLIGSYTLSGTNSVLQDTQITDSNGVYTFTVYAHTSSTAPYIQPTIWLSPQLGGPTGEAENISVRFNVQTGDLIFVNTTSDGFKGKTSNEYSYSSTNVGNGWYKYTVSLIGNAARNNNAKWARAETYYTSGTVLTGNLILWATQLEQRDSSGPYIKTTTAPVIPLRNSNFVDLKSVEPAISLPTTVTTATADAPYYFLTTGINRRYDRSRKFTSNDTLVYRNYKVGYNNPNPTFAFDVSGTIRSTNVIAPTLSTQNITNNQSVNITAPGTVTLNSNISSSQNIIINTLTSTNVFATNLTALSTVVRFLPTTNTSLISGVSGVIVLTSGLTVTGGITANNAGVSQTFTTLTLDATSVNTNTLNVTNSAIFNRQQKNLLLYSNDFTKWFTVGNFVSAVPNAAIAPDGTQTATRYIELSSATASIPRLRGNASDEPRGIVNIPYTFSIYAKGGLGRDVVQLDGWVMDDLNRADLVTPRWIALYDITTGVILTATSATAGASAISTNIQSVGNDWHRLSLTVIPYISSDIKVSRLRNRVCLLTAAPMLSAGFNTLAEQLLAPGIPDNGGRYIGTNLSGIYIWGAQFEQNTQATEYQDVTVYPNVTASNIYGRVFVDPNNSEIGYNNQNQLDYLLDQDLTFGIKPSDSFSTDDTNVIRTINGSWDNNSTEPPGVLKPYFKNPKAVRDYVANRNLRGRNLRIYLYEDVIVGERKPNGGTTPTDQSGQYRGLLTSGGNLSAAFFSTEWLGANYPALTAAGLRGGDYVWPVNPAANINGGFEHWYIDRLMRFKFIFVQGLHNIGPRILGPGQNFYVVDKPFDMPSPKFIHRTYICADKNLTFGTFGTQASAWTTATTRNNCFGRQFHINTFADTETILRNVGFEFECNPFDSTAIVIYNSPRTYLQNVSISMLGQGVYPFGGVGVQGGDQNTTGTIAIVEGIPTIDPYFLTPSTWNNGQWSAIPGSNGPAYFPGYGIAFVGNPPSSPFFTNIPRGFFHTMQEGRGPTIYIYDFQSPLRRFGRESYIQNSLILDGKWNPIFATFDVNAAYGFPGYFFFLNKNTEYWFVPSMFKTNTFQLSTFRIYIEPTNTSYTYNLTLSTYANFYPAFWEQSFATFKPYNWQLRPWRFDSTIAPGIDYSNNLTIYHGIKDDWDILKWRVNTTTKTVNVSGFMVPDDIPDGSLVRRQYNHMRFWTPLNTETEFRNYISPNELLNINTPGYFTLASPLSSSLSATIVFYTSATR